MNEILRYLILSSVCVTLLYVVYAAFLHRETFFQINRIYLLMTILFSLVIPLMPLGGATSMLISPFMVYLEPVIITPEKIAHVTNQNLGWMEAILIVYATGVAIFGCRFLIQLLQLWVLTRRNGIERQDSIRLVYVDNKFSPFSFFNLIYLKRSISDKPEWQPILEHELVHIRQLHSLDLILAEWLIILQWFNPFAWLLHRSLRSVHEYLADEGVVRTGMERYRYQQLILDQSLGFQLNNLTNNFNISLLKKRLMMMTKAPSTRMAKCMVLLAIPSMMLVMAFMMTGTFQPLQAQDKAAQKNKQAKEEYQKQQQALATDKEDVVFEKVEQSPEYTGGVDQLYAFLGKNIQYPKEAVDKKITGTVFVSFIIEKDGSVSNAKILRGIGAGCDEEALRVVKLMPKWKPGMDKGKVVRVSYALPIKFTMK